jgi:hypothetical protein
MELNELIDRIYRWKTGGDLNKEFELLEEYAEGKHVPNVNAEYIINSIRHSIEAAKDTGKDTSAEETLLAKLAERARARDKKEEEEKKKK